MLPQDLTSDLLAYMIKHRYQPGDQLPTLTELSSELGISVNKLREQLEVARVLGMVDVRPRAGIRVNEYSFLPAVRLSLLYALAMDHSSFQPFGDLRINIEVCFWREAVACLQPADLDALDAYIEKAWHKLNGAPVRIPHREHRAFHLTIFGHLDNPFVKSLLEAYWEAYEAEEYHVYADYEYLRQVWSYHERIVQALRLGDVEGSLVAFIEHTRLLRYRNSPGSEYSSSLDMASVTPGASTDNLSGQPD